MKVMTQALIFFFIFIAVESQRLYAGSGNAVALNDNKFRNRTPKRLEEIVFGGDVSSTILQSKCHFDVDVVWKRQLGGPLSSTPILLDLLRDGSKEIVASLSNNYVEVLRTSDGRKLSGWPHVYPEGTNVYTSPLSFEQEGRQLLIVTTARGEVVTLGPDGVPLHVLKLPPLYVKRDWYEGLDGPEIQATMSLHSDQEDRPKWSQPDTFKKRSNFNMRGATRSLQQVSNSDEQATFEGMTGSLSPEAVKSLALFLNTDISLNSPASFAGSSAYAPFIKHPPPDRRAADRSFVAIPPHCLATPVIADLDGDGFEELIVAVSYYFDYDPFTNIEEEDVSVQLDKYVAGGIVVYDMQNFDLKWTLHLDLTTESTSYRGYVTSAPTVVDFDGDGKLEILVGTNVGFLYLISHDGEVRTDGFPLMMDTIQGIPIQAVDITGDGFLDIIAVDQLGNVAVFDHAGQEIWETQVERTSTSPVIADVNGDGILDIVVGTRGATLHAFRGDTGKSLPNFPIKLSGAVTASPIVTRLREDTVGLQIVFHAADGVLYIIDGASGCAEKIRLGGRTTSSVLVEDVTGTGTLNFLVFDGSGLVTCLETSAPYHPLRTWSAERLGANDRLFRENHSGVFIMEGDRLHTRMVHGHSYQLRFEIVDTRSLYGPYHIKVKLNGVTTLSIPYDTAGAYQLPLDLTHIRGHVTVELLMTNKHRLIHRDELSLEVKLYYHRLYKWLLLVPFGLMTFVMLFVKDLATPLPS